MTSTIPAAAIEKHRLILLEGDEELYRRLALVEILQSLEMDKEDFDYASFVADERPPIEWIASAGTAPFLAQRRVVTVRNLLRIEANPALLSELQALPASALLVLVADDEMGQDDKITRMKGPVKRSWIKLVNDAGGKVFSFAADRKKSKDWVMAEVKRRGKTISSTAADVLVEMTGDNLSRAAEELDKLELYVGDSPAVREEDVREVTMPSREWNVFKMVEATLSGNVAEALHQLKIVVTNNAKVQDVAMRSIFPATGAQLRLIWQARAMIDAGENLQNPSPEFLARLPVKPNLTKEADWRKRKIFSIARRVSLEQIDQCLQYLSDADCRLKGLLPSFMPIEALEQMILEMVNIVQSRPHARR